MKLDLLLEYKGAPALIAWARETSLGVYMGVRFSPEVENLSCFQDGRRELLRFPVGRDGKREREEVPIDPIPPIALIEYAQPILDRVVDVLGDGASPSPAPKPSPETTNITIPQDTLADGRWLYYEAHIVRSARLPEFLAAAGDGPAVASGENGSSVYHFPLHHFSRTQLRADGSAYGGTALQLAISRPADCVILGTGRSARDFCAVPVMMIPISRISMGGRLGSFARFLLRRRGCHSKFHAGRFWFPSSRCSSASAGDMCWLFHRTESNCER